MPTPFHTTRRVEFSDTDMAGVVHFSAYFRFMETAEHELLRSLGLSVYDLVNGEVVSFPRVSAKCDYTSPLRYDDLVDIEVIIKRVGGKSVTYAFRLAHEGRKVAEGEMTSVCCRVEHGRPPVSIAIPDEFAAKLRGMIGG